jgi:hypothetical protein
MKWVLRLGLGSQAPSLPGAGPTVMSWDEIVETRPAQSEVAIEFAKRVGERMLAYAITHAQDSDPLLIESGPRVDVAFTARVRTSAMIDVLVGPEQFKLDNVGIAIAVGRDAVLAGARLLNELADITRAAGLLEHELRK